MSEEEKPEDVNYIFTNSRCFHPFFGDGRVLLDKKNKKIAILFSHDSNSHFYWWFDYDYSYIIIENIEELNKGFVILKEDGSTGISLTHCGIDINKQPIFSEGKTVVFYNNDEDTVYVRFDGVVSDPIQYDGEYDAPSGEEAEKWFSGAEYLRAPSRYMPDPLIDFSKTTISLFNYRDPTGRTDLTELEYELEIDTSMLAAWGKETGSYQDKFCGEYVGLGTNAGKKFRLGYGEWYSEDLGESFYESLKTQQDGSILIDGLTFLEDEDKFVYHDKESDGGYWWTAKDKVKLGASIILNYEQGNNPETKPQIVIDWQGYTWYAPKKITDEDGNHMTVNAPLHTEKINAMDAPVWR